MLKKLYALQKKQIFTDVCLALQDDIDSNMKIDLHCHRIVLMANCEFFDRLFTYNLEKRIVLQVSNVHIARDTIMEFYGVQNHSEIVKSFAYQYEKMKLCHFWIFYTI
jgi:hypothetical protein